MYNNYYSNVSLEFAAQDICGRVLTVLFVVVLRGSLKIKAMEEARYGDQPLSKGGLK